MSQGLCYELKRDLEGIYKITGDLLNLMEAKDLRSDVIERDRFMELLKFKLEDMGGTLQKDIFNCDYLITKDKIIN